MNIIDLYRDTPPEKHGNIKVVSGRVLVTSDEGSDEYLMDASGELYLVSSDRSLRQDITAIKGKLGI